MKLNAMELNERTRERLAFLAEKGKSHSLAVCRDLIDLGYDAKVAWALVEGALELKSRQLMDELNEPNT